MNNIKSNEKGSVTLIVLVTILFIIIILSSFLVYISSRRRSQIKETEAISENYDGNMEEIYNSLKSPLERITGYETTNTDTTDKNGNRIVVPAGFKVVNPNDTVDDGIIIEDISANNSDTIGNQFVWIPCTIDGANGSLKYDRYAFSRETPTWASNQTKILGTNGEYEKDADGSYKIQRADLTSYYFHEALSDEERQSVEKYGGYYFRQI